MSTARIWIAAIAAALIGHAPLAAASSQLITPHCGQTIGPGGSWRLAAGMICGGATSALRIVGPTRVDMAGSTIKCQDGNRQTGVEITGTGARVSAGFVDGCGTSVGILGSGGHSVIGFHVSEFNPAAFNVVGNGNVLEDNVADESRDG